jgi:probable F420-dependent oxidoreductase
VARFRFAVQLTGAADGRAWRELARRVEGLGYSTLYVPDHFGDQWDPVVAMCVAAEATSQLRVGSLVFDNDFRHPVVLAKQVATLDLASEGRVEFGLGAGWLRSDYETSGIGYDPAGVRVERMAEALAVMKALWSEGRASFSGRHYRVEGATGAPLPRSRPHPTIVIGGGSPKVLSIAAREADVVGINPSLAAGEVNAQVAASARAERFRERVAWVRQAAGERFGSLELQCLTFAVQVVPDARRVLDSVAPLFGVSPDDAAEMPIVLVGSEEEIVERLQQRREEYGFSYWVIHQAEMEAFAPIVARLAGT